MKAHPKAGPRLPNGVRPVGVVRRPVQWTSGSTPLAPKSVIGHFLDSLFWNEPWCSWRRTSAKYIMFLPFTGNLVPVVLTTEPLANYRECRPAHPGRSGAVDACYMDIRTKWSTMVRARGPRDAHARGAIRTGLPSRLALRSGLRSTPGRVRHGHPSSCSSRATSSPRFTAASLALYAQLTSLPRMVGCDRSLLPVHRELHALR